MGIELCNSLASPCLALPCFAQPPLPSLPSYSPQVSSSNPTEARTAAKRHYDGDFLMEQKLESAKAAILCGGVGAASRLLAVGVGAAVPPLLREALATPEPVASAVLFGLAAGFVQGALFGLTYRQGSPRSIVLRR